jgi:hypothetical protein
MALRGVESALVGSTQVSSHIPAHIYFTRPWSFHCSQLEWDSGSTFDHWRSRSVTVRLTDTAAVIPQCRSICSDFTLCARALCVCFHTFPHLWCEMPQWLSSPPASLGSRVRVPWSAPQRRLNPRQGHGVYLFKVVSRDIWHWVLLCTNKD